MRGMIAPLAGFGLFAAAVGAAHAAAPAYCALYAREYANQFSEAAGQKEGSEQKIQDEAYYRCLNQDEEPALPQTSAYYGTEVNTGDEAVKPAEAAKTAAVDATTDNADTPSTPARPAVKKVQQASAAPAKKYYGSGMQAWTPEWKEWCQGHFPNSFNEKDGSILPLNGGGKRIFCK